MTASPSPRDARPYRARPYRGRLAPSPTGLLHLGHARTFWIASQRSLAANGTLLLRNEDLDPQRSKPHFVDAMLEDLHWLGIRWYEGLHSSGKNETGKFGPYSQSARTMLYRIAWEKLRSNGWIYPCTCSRRDLTQALVKNVTGEEDEDDNGDGDDDEPVYPGTCRPATGAIAEAGDATVVNWRFRIPDAETVAFTDKNLGARSYKAGRGFGDFLVWRRDHVPSYQLACVVDDAAMQITEVVRGADLLKSTARQILLNRALSYRNPDWFHCELLRDEHGQRLAKRHDSLSLRTLRERGVSVHEVLRMAGIRSS